MAGAGPHPSSVSLHCEQSRRRDSGQASIFRCDCRSPDSPLARAGLYDELQQVERLLEEHSHCETMFPERAHELEHQIEHLLEQASWREEIPEEEDWLNALSNFLCDIKESQIRSGLHFSGKYRKDSSRLSSC